MFYFIDVASQFIDDDEHPIYCFQCNSGIDPDCRNIQQNDTSSYHYKPCLDTEKYNGSKPFCRKVLQKSKYATKVLDMF